MIRKLTDSSTFRSVAKGALEMASAFIRIVEALEPLLPLLTSLIALKIGSALAPGLGALTGIGPKRKAAGGRIQGFARGGFVPGSGNGDTVPAMLQPGEFVIKKSSAKKLGSGTLESMNQNRFKVGGEQLAKQIAAKRKDPKFSGKASKGGVGVLNQLESQITNLPKKDVYGGAFLSPEGGSQDLRGSVEEGAVKAAFNKNATFKLLKSAKKGSVLKKEAADLEKAASKKTDFTLLARSLTPELSTKVEAKILDGVESSVRGGAAEFAKATKVRSPNKDMSGILRTANVDNVIGNLFEASVLRAGAPYDESERDSANAPFDFPGGLGGISKAFTNAGALSKIDTDAKTRYTSGNISSFLTKVRDTKTNQLTSQLDRIISELDPSDIQEQFSSRGGDAKMAGKKLKDKVAAKKAHGGKIDSVPALLTPGEYVINKSAAQSIGYSNLNTMNKTGAQKFATGGAVGWKRFAGGGPTGAGLGLGVMPGFNADFSRTTGGVAGDLAAVEAALAKIGITAGTVVDEFGNQTSSQKYIDAIAAVEKALEEGAGQAGAFDKAFEEMKNGIDETKKAAEDAASAAQTVANKEGAGDIVAADVTKFGGEIDTGVSTGGLVEAAKKDNAVRERLIQTQKQEVAAIQRKIKATESGVTSANAFKRAQDVVRDKYGVLAKEIEKTKSASEKLRAKAGAVRGAVTRGARGGAGGVGRAAAGAQGVAEGAQQLAFMATVAGGAAIQMSGLSDATKQAATETLGFAAGLVGTGATVIQMLSGLQNIGAAATVSETAEIAANAGSTASEEVETTANLKSAASEGGMSGSSKALLGVAAAAVIVSVAFKFFAAKARAQADKLAKSTEKLIAILEAGKGGDATGIQSNVQTEINERGESAALNAGSTVAISGGLVAGVAASLLLAKSAAVSALAVSAFGATVGSSVPILGTAIGAIVGLGIGLFKYNKIAAEAAKAAERQRDSIKGSIEAYVNATKGVATFNQQLADIDIEKNLAPDEKVKRRLKAGEEDVGAGTVGGEFDKLGELAAKAGKSIAQLTEADFEGMPAELQAFRFATLATQKTMEGLAAKTKAARDTLAQAADIEITGELTFDELIAQGGLFAQSLKAAEDAIQRETQAKVKAINAEVASMRAVAAVTDNVETQAEVVAAANAKQEEATAAQERGTRQLEDLRKGQQMAAEAATKQRDAELAAAAAAQALAEQLRKTSEFMKELTGIQFAQGQESKDLDNRIAVQSGGDLDFSRDIEGLQGDPTQIRDVGKFEREIAVAIDDLPAGVDRARAQEQVETVSQANRVFNEGKENVTNRFSGPPAGNFGPAQQKEIIRAAGLDPDTMDPRVLAEIMKSIVEKAKDGIDSADFDEIFSPIAEAAGPAQESLKAINDIRNADLANYKKYLNGVSAVRDADLKSQQQRQQVSQKGAELRAEARGKPLSRRKKERARTDSAQLALRGTGIQAGDSRAATQRLRDAKLQHKAIQQQLKNQKLSAVRLKELAREEEKAKDVIKKTTAELERLANQTDKAADIMSEIDKERSKRETVTGLIEDFVVAGNEQRGKMVAAFNGVNQAVSTGTLQNQSPEQRQATVGLLDKLSDIEIAGTGGLTGKEVKQELIFRDAIELGLDPAIAEGLATATTKEQKLIDALDKLTRQMERAATGLGVANQPFAQGGPVQYRAGGGSIFQPKGTDTVPAMLTPGEFVIKKSAVDNIGVGNLQALNRANGGVVTPVYRSGGGVIDTENRQAFIGQLDAAVNASTFFVSDPDETAILGLMRSSKNRGYVAKDILSNIKTHGNRDRDSPLDKIYAEIPQFFANVRSSFTDEQRAELSRVLAQNKWDKVIEKPKTPKPQRQRPEEVQNPASQYVTISPPSLTNPDGKLIRLPNPYEPTALETRSDEFYIWQSKQNAYVDAYNNKLKAKREEAARLEADEQQKTRAAEAAKANEANRNAEDVKSINEQAAAPSPAIDGPRRDSPGYDPSIHSPAARKKEANARAKEKAQKEENINVERSIKAAELDTPGGESGQEEETLTTEQKQLRAYRKRQERLKKKANEKAEKAAAAPQIASATYPTSAEGIFQTPRGISAPNIAKFLKENLQHDEALAYIKAYKAAGENPAKISGGNLFKESEAQLIMTGQPVRDSKTLNGRFTENPKLSVLTPDEKLFFLWASSKTNTRGGLSDVASARDPKNILFFLKNRKRIRDSFLDQGFQSNAPTLGENHKKGPEYLNSGGSVGGGGALMLAAGGNVPGFANGGQADTVPAMLTPGEFVMSRESVQKHGIGYMKNLNRGRIPGFNRGGVVGRGNVQYKHNGGGVDNGNGGGVVSIDPSKMQGVLDDFNTSFSASLDKIVGPFTGVSESLGRIADAFGSMTMTHEFSGNVSVNVNIGNKDAIIEAVKTGISGPEGPIAKMITKQVNAAIEAQINRPAG